MIIFLEQGQTVCQPKYGVKLSEFHGLTMTIGQKMGLSSYLCHSMRKSRLINHIENLEAEDLREEIVRLYDTLKEVKDFYKMELGSEAERQKKYEKAKADIASKFISRGYRKVRPPRVSKVRKLVKDLKLISIFPHEMIDIHLYICETALDFCYNRNFTSDPVFNLIRDSYHEGKKLILSSGLTDDYSSRLEKLEEDMPYEINL